MTHQPAHKTHHWMHFAALVVSSAYIIEWIPSHTEPWCAFWILIWIFSTLHNMYLRHKVGRS